MSLPTTVTHPTTGSTWRSACSTAVALALVVAGVALTHLPAHAAPPKTGKVSVYGLAVNDLVNPLGIEVAAPSLGWKTRSTGRGVRQTAYQVRSAANEHQLASDPLWDSGKVESDVQVDVVYEGPALASRTKYRWQVRIWDNRGNVSKWSDPAWFETAMQSIHEWEASWIGGVDRGQQIGDWSDYTVDADLTLKPGTAFGVYLRSSTNAANAYMWQLNDETDGQPRLRPHVKVDGGFSVLGEVDLTSAGLPADVLKGRVQLTVVLSGSTITTKVNGVVVDTRTDTSHAAGFVGGRTAPPESATLHSLSATTPTRTLYESDFASGENPFNAGTIVPGADGGLLLEGQTDAIWSPPTNLPLLRKGFSTIEGKQVATARVYASALGLYELNLNGEKVGDQELAPGWTDYTKRIQYQTHDVTALIEDGPNAIGAWVGAGWYSGHIAWFGDRGYGDTNSVIAQLEITYTDGTTQAVSTDSSWKTSMGPLVSADLLMGENYDARREQPGWSSSRFDDSTWLPVSERSEAATSMLRPQADEPVRVTERVPTRARTESPGGSFIYDVGQNLSGVARITMTGRAGQTVRIRHAEVLNTDGSVYTANLRSAKATDYYTFAEDGSVTYRPHFTQHGFRYIEITGLQDAPAAADVSAEVFGSDLATTGAFETSDPMLNQLQSNIYWGQRGNFISVPTDTPARDERLGYTGDLNAFAGTAAFNMDSLAFVKKWLKDLRDTQLPSGAYTDTAPRGDKAGCCTVGAGWSDAGITIPWTMYKRYDDVDVIASNYDSMLKYFDYLATNYPDYVRDDGPFGDWLHLDDPTPGAVIGTAYYAYDARLMSEMAAALGKTADAEDFARLADDITAVFVEEFVSADGRVTGDSQTAYALALGMDLVPDDLRAAAGEKLVAEVASRDYHLSTGFVGTPWLMPALSESGSWETAYRLLMNKTLPSWGFEVVMGATTMWERWDSIDANGNFGDAAMNSFNHYAFGAVGDWMYQNIGGLQVEKEGYKSFTVAPRPGGGLTHASTELDSPYGEISTSWKTGADGFSLAVEVPSNTTAEIEMPTDSRWAVTESGEPAEFAESVRFLGMEDGAAVYEVGSGRYEFGIDPVLGRIGAAREDVTALQDTAEELAEDGSIAGPVSKHLDSKLTKLAREVQSTWDSHVDGNDDAAASDGHRALATAASLGRWISTQEKAGRIDAEDADALRSALEMVTRDLSAASAGLVGAVVTLTPPSDGQLPGKTVSVDLVIENRGDRALRSVASSLGVPADWTATRMRSKADTVERGQTLVHEYAVEIPEDAEARTWAIDGTVTYRYQSSSATLPVAASILVVPAVVVDSVALDPATVDPGGRATVQAVLTNRSGVPRDGALAVALPAGWAEVAPAAFTVPASGSTTVEATVRVPLSVTEESVPVGVSVGTSDLERRTATLDVAFVNPPAVVVDHVDLGDAESERSHALTASSASGTNTEAGLTRRYTNPTPPGGWFEFELRVPEGEPFVLRAVETYDRPQLKTYDVLVDGHVVHARRYQRTGGGIGSLSFQFVVDEPHLFDDGVIIVRFQDVGADYDPSIADVWSLPVDAAGGRG